MLDAFLEYPFFLNRHRQAPLLKERESFLNHLQQQGTSRKALRNLSAELLGRGQQAHQFSYKYVSHVHGDRLRDPSRLGGKI